MPQRASPNKGTPWIENGLLHLPQGDTEQTLPVESEAWATWLERATQFYVKNTQYGNFSCRKETRQRGSSYWSAYRRVKGHAYHIYVGKDSDLTTQRLDEIAHQLDETILDRGVATVTHRKKRIAPPNIKTVQVEDDKLWFHLTDGRVLGAPLEWFPRLVNATLKQRQQWEIIGEGISIHWPDIDERISVRVLMNLPS